MKLEEGEKIRIKLSSRQMKKLQPLFDEIEKVNENPEMFAKSSIILQPQFDGSAEGCFMPPKYAIEIRKIINKYFEELKEG